MDRSYITGGRLIALVVLILAILAVLGVLPADNRLAVVGLGALALALLIP
jgi:hypothetical protein